MLPPTILTEAIAQVGAIMILAKPENREQLPFFAGIERVRYRRTVHPGDVVVIEAIVRRLRSRMGILRGIARVDGHVVVEGTMTFALGAAHRSRGHVSAARVTPLRPSPRARPTPPMRDRGPGSASVSRMAGARTSAPIQRSSMRAESAIPRVSRSSGPVLAKAAPSTSTDAPTLKAKTPLTNGALLAAEVRPRVSSHSLVACWTQKPADEITNSCAARQLRSWVMAKNGMP